MNGLVVLAACVCATSGQLLANPAWAPQQSHQFHAQDEFGQFSFGHAGGPSARTESRNAYGVTQGSYQYVDANGLLQTVNYVADANGFRAAGTNLPVAPVAGAAPAVAPLVAPVFNLVGPAPVEDTPEVAAAKAEFAVAYAAAEAAAAAPAERKRREAQVVLPAATAGLPFPYAGVYGAAGVYAAAPANIVANIAPAAATYALGAAPLAAAPVPIAAPLAYNTAVSAPAAREAVLTTIKLNPGHATFYRVD